MASARPNRGAEGFDAFRRELIRRALPVQKEERKAWEERFKAFVEASLPEPRKLFQKPGLAARLFAAEVEVPNSHPRDLEVYSQQLDLIWEAKLPDEVVEWRTLTTPDRTDLVWEFAVDLGASYVTGSVKLRNFPFERPERRDRPQGERPYQRDDRPSGGYQGNRDRPSGGYQGNRDRPSGGGYQGNRDRPQGGGGYNRNDRPQGGGGYNRNDRSQGGGGYNRNDRPQGGGYRGDRPQGGGFNRDSGFKPRGPKFGGRPYKKRPENS